MALCLSACVLTKVGMICIEAYMMIDFVPLLHFVKLVSSLNMDFQSENILMTMVNLLHDASHSTLTVSAHYLYILLLVIGSLYCGVIYQSIFSQLVMSSLVENFFPNKSE